MSRDRLRPFSFLPPSTGDTLLRSASRCELSLHRLPSEDLPVTGDEGGAADPPQQSDVELNFELAGTLPLNGRDAGHLLTALIREFRKPRQPRREGGEA